MHYVNGDCTGKGKGHESLSEARLLWKRSKAPKFPTRYNFTRFAITLNELTPGLKVCFVTKLILFFVFPLYLFIYILRKKEYSRKKLSTAICAYIDICMLIMLSLELIWFFDNK